MTRTIDVSQDVPGCVGGIRERPPVDIGGGIRGGGGGGRGGGEGGGEERWRSWERAARAARGR